MTPSFLKRLMWSAIAVSVLNGSVRAASLDAQATNEAQWTGEKVQPGTISPRTVKLQILLDRAHFSPGEIDGQPGENLDKAIAAYAASQGSEQLTSELWRNLTEAASSPVIVEHKLTEGDVKGPFIEKMPLKMEAMKGLKALAYVSPKEKIAEQFHISPALLTALNPGQHFDRPGDTILVPNISREGLEEKAARIEVDKSKQVLKVFGKSDALLAFFPITAGSREKPAPDGVLRVVSVTKNPTYRYNPDYAFKGVKTKRPFEIQPGPNNPVGSVWIELNKESYGIHGTPEPSKVSKSESHGCIRLTNWDALRLASMLGKGVPVEFAGDERQRVSGERAKRRR